MERLYEKILPEVEDSIRKKYEATGSDPTNLLRSMRENPPAVPFFTGRPNDQFSEELDDLCLCDGQSVAGSARVTYPVDLPPDTAQVIVYSDALRNRLGEKVTAKDLAVKIHGFQALDEKGAPLISFATDDYQWLDELAHPHSWK